MARLTYAQVRSAASALIREKYAENKNNKLKLLVYKDAGGNFNKRILRDGITICYIELKAIVWITDNGEIVTDVSRETISSILEEYHINFVYAKFG